jgi:HSP20 family protein
MNMFTMVPYRRYLTKPVRPFESFFNDSFFRNFLNGTEGLLTNSFRVDVRDTDDAYVIEAEMPGLKEEQIKLEVDDGMLTISADFQNEIKQEDSDKLYCERRSGHMERSFNLENIDADNISAKYKDGILYVNLPKEKPVEKTARRIPVLVESQENKEQA